MCVTIRRKMASKRAMRLGQAACRICRGALPRFQEPGTKRGGDFELRYNFNLHLYMPPLPSRYATDAGNYDYRNDLRGVAPWGSAGVDR